MWARKPRTADGTRGDVSESLRWLEGYERLTEMAPQLGQTRLVYVADREADIIALMVAARDSGTPVDWLSFASIGTKCFTSPRNVKVEDSVPKKLNIYFGGLKIHGPFEKAFKPCL